jgi:type VI secretion system secreted protein Hcp
MKAMNITAWIAAMLLISVAGVGKGQTSKVSMAVDGFRGDDGIVGSAADLLAFSHEVDIPTDDRTGQPAGSRRHSPVSVMKRVNAASPSFARALAASQLITSVRFEFYKMDQRGVDVRYATVVLEDARLVSSRIEKIWETADNGEIARTPVEYLDFIYTLIRWKNDETGDEIEDYWRSPTAKTSETRRPHAPNLATRLDGGTSLVLSESPAQPLLSQANHKAVSTVGEALLTLPPGTYLYSTKLGGSTADGWVTLPSHVRSSGN